MKLNVVLLHPQIPQNTGNIGRQCICYGAKLHLIKPLGFSIEESQVKRAGLDYWKKLDPLIHDSWEDFLRMEKPERIFFSTTKTDRPCYEFDFQSGDYIIFGSESHGLPPAFYQDYESRLYTIPMLGEGARSLNLANSVGIILYEAARQFLQANPSKPQ